MFSLDVLLSKQLSTLIHFYQSVAYQQLVCEPAIRDEVYVMICFLLCFFTSYVIMFSSVEFKCIDEVIHSLLTITQRKQRNREQRPLKLSTFSRTINRSNRQQLHRRDASRIFFLAIKTQACDYGMYKSGGYILIHVITSY